MALGERPGGDVSRRFGLRHFGRIAGALVVAVTIGIATYASAEPAPPAYLPSGAPGPEVPIPGNDPDLVHSDESGAAFSIASPQHPADFPDPSYEWLYTLVWDDSPRGALGVRWVDAGETLVPVDCQARGERWHRYAWVFGDGISVRAVGAKSSAVESVWCESDTDGIRDDLDVCPDANDSSQCDTNGDGLGNACDADYDDNGGVGISDFNRLRNAMGTAVGDLGYDPDVDSNCDGIVGIPDFGRFRNLFNEHRDSKAMMNPPPNVPQDRDADGLPDFIYVTPDFDSSDGGARLLTDVEAAYGLLTDPDLRHVVVGPGVYECRDTFPGKLGCLNIGSHTTLECLPGAVLRGQDVTHNVEHRPVVHDDDSIGLRDITIRSCEIDGGAPRGLIGTATGGGATSLDDTDIAPPFEPGQFDGVAWGDRIVLRPEGPDREFAVIVSHTANAFEIHPPWDRPPEPGDSYYVTWDAATIGDGARRGIDIGPLSGIEDVVIEGNYVHDSYHACIYSKNGTRVSIRNNLVEYCGGFFHDIGSQNQPGIYLFADTGNVSDDVAVLDNIVRYAKAAGVNTRRKSSLDFMERMLIDGNEILLATDAEAEGASGLRLSGLSNSIVMDNTVTGGRHFANVIGGQGWFDSWPGPNRGLVLDTLVGRDLSDVPGAIGVSISAHQTGLRVSNLDIENTPAGAVCMHYAAPQRGSELDGVQLKRCGAGGIVNGTHAAGWGKEPDSALVLRNISIDGTRSHDRQNGPNAYAIQIRGGDASGPTTADGSILEGIVIRDSVGGIRFENGVTDSTFANIDVDMLQAGFLGVVSHSEAAAIVCDAQVIDEWLILGDAAGNSDCEFSSGIGSVENACVCSPAGWIDMRQEPRPQCMRWEGAADSGNLVTNMRCGNVMGDDAYGIQVGPGTSATLFEDLEGFDTRGTTADLNMNGVLDTQGATGVTVDGAVCFDTHPATPCIAE
jgi:hypothetical protein